MIELDQIIKETSKKTQVNNQTVEAICKHVFKHTVDVMKDTNDCHDILFNGLFKFKLKNRFKDDRHKKYNTR